MGKSRVQMSLHDFAGILAQWCEDYDIFYKLVDAALRQGLSVAEVRELCQILTPAKERLPSHHPRAKWEHALLISMWTEHNGKYTGSTPPSEQQWSDFREALRWARKLLRERVGNTIGLDVARDNYGDEV